MLLCKFKNLAVTLTMLMTVNAFPKLLPDPEYSSAQKCFRNTLQIGEKWNFSMEISSWTRDSVRI